MGNVFKRKKKEVEHECQLEQEPDILSEYYAPDQKCQKWFRSICLLSKNKSHGKIYIKSKHAIEVDRTIHLATHFYIIHPFSVLRFYWEIFMVIFLFVSLNALTYCILIEVKYQTSIQIFLFIMTLFCWCDIFLNFFTGYFDRATKSVVLDPDRIARKYVLKILINMIVCIPYDNICYLTRQNQFTVRLLSLLRVLNIVTMLSYAERIREKKQFSFYKFRGLEILVILIIAIHWITCAAGLGIIADNYLSSEMKTLYDSEFSYQKWLTKAISLIFSLGDSNLTLIGWEFAVQFFAICFSMIMRNVIIVQIMLMFKSNNFSRRKYNQLIRELHEYMQFKTLPSRTRQRILNYYYFMYQNMYYNEKEIREQLSDKLLEEVEKYIFAPVFEMNLFAQCPKTLVEELLSRFQLDIYLNNDVIYSQGEIAECMFFLKCGTVAVYVHNGKEELMHIEEGSFFGEMSFLGNDEIRRTTVIALEPCELYKLYGKDFNSVIVNYPECYENIQEQLQHQKEWVIEMDRVLEEDATNLKQARILAKEYFNNIQ